MKSKEYTIARFKCQVCDKLTAGRQVSGLGVDGHESFPRRHRDAMGEVCEGTHLPASRVRVPASQVKTRIN